MNLTALDNSSPTDSTFSVSNFDSSRIAIVSVTTTSLIGALLSRSFAGPDRRACVAQTYTSAANILVKSRGSSIDALPALRATVAGLDPNLPIFGVMTLDEATSVSFLPVKVAASLTAALGGLALVLGTIGLYGVMSYIVRQRTRELGIRIALGARAGAVVRLITRQGMLWTAIGLALGLGAAFGVAKLIAGFLYGIGPADPVAFGAITLLLTGTAFVACYLPARRASRIDPLTALRDQ